MKRRSLLLLFVSACALSCALSFAACGGGSSVSDSAESAFSASDSGTGASDSLLSSPSDSSDPSARLPEVTFVADGETVAVLPYAPGSGVEEPEVPEKPGYAGKWEPYTLSGGDVAVHAVYTPVEYLITFTAEGKIVWAGTYTVEDEGVEEPEVPQKRGYEGRWREYTLLPGGVAVSAVYTPIEYTISFIADGKTVAERKFTVEDEDALLPPALPEKVGHSGAWEEFSFDYADLEVHAVYTPLSYTVAATGGEGQGSVEGGGVYPFGSRAVLRATPYPGYVFSGWYRGDALISEEAEYAFSVPAEDTAYTAKFAVREDMLPFTFVSEADSCTVTGRVGEDADKVVLPDCVTAVGYDAFFASDVREVVLPDSVTLIGDSAFYGCKQLRKVTVGKGLHFFRYGAFEGCEGIEEVHISDLSAWCSAVFFDEHSNPLSYGARLYLNGEETVELNLQGIEKIEDRAFENCPSPASVSLGEGAEEIGRYAFAGCLSLKSVRFPASLTSIGAGAFRGCTALDGESFPSKLESIGGEAFRNCGAWTVGDIPDSVTYVGAYAFEGCASLGALSLPDGGKAVSVGVRAFADCPALSSVSVGACRARLENDAFAGCSALREVRISDLFFWCESEFANPSANPLSAAGKLLLNGAEVVDLVLPESVETVAARAFYGCTSLVGASLPAVVRTGEEAFAHCASLRSVSFGGAAVFVENRAFEGCAALTSAVFGKADRWFVHPSGSSVGEGVPLPEEGVSDPARAAAWLTGEYCDRFWKR